MTEAEKAVVAIPELMKQEINVINGKVVIEKENQMIIELETSTTKANHGLKATIMIKQQKQDTVRQAKREANDQLVSAKQRVSEMEAALDIFGEEVPQNLVVSVQQIKDGILALQKSIDDQSSSEPEEVQNCISRLHEELRAGEKAVQQATFMLEEKTAQRADTLQRFEILKDQKEILDRDIRGAHLANLADFETLLANLDTTMAELEGRLQSPISVERSSDLFDYDIQMVQDFGDKIKKGEELLSERLSILSEGRQKLEECMDEIKLKQLDIEQQLDCFGQSIPSMVSESISKFKSQCKECKENIFALLSPEDFDAAIKQLRDLMDAVEMAFQTASAEYQRLSQERDAYMDQFDKLQEMMLEIQKMANDNKFANDLQIKTLFSRAKSDLAKMEDLLKGPLNVEQSASIDDLPNSFQSFEELLGQIRDRINYLINEEIQRQGALELERKLARRQLSDALDKTEVLSKQAEEIAKEGDILPVAGSETLAALNDALQQLRISVEAGASKRQIKDAVNLVHDQLKDAEERFSALEALRKDLKAERERIREEAHQIQSQIFKSIEHNKLSEIPEVSQGLETFVGLSEKLVLLLQRPLDPTDEAFFAPEKASLADLKDCSNKLEVLISKERDALQEQIALAKAELNTATQKVDSFLKELDTLAESSINLPTEESDNLLAVQETLGHVRVLIQTAHTKGALHEAVEKMKAQVDDYQAAMVKIMALAKEVARQHDANFQRFNTLQGSMKDLVAEAKENHVHETPVIMESLEKASDSFLEAEKLMVAELVISLDKDPLDKENKALDIFEADFKSSKAAVDFELTRKRMIKGITLLQAVVRGVIIRKLLNLFMGASTQIQALVRGFLGRKAVEALREEQNALAKLSPAEMERELELIVLIQARVRGYLARLRYIELIAEMCLVDQVYRFDVSVRQLLLGNIAKLRGIFKTYMKYPEQAFDRNSALKFAQHFDIVPKLLSIRRYNEVISEVARRNLRQGDDAVMSFEQFLKHLIIISLQYVKKQQLKLSVHRFNELITVMEESQGHGHVIKSRYTTFHGRFMLFDSQDLPSAEAARFINLAQLVRGLASESFRRKSLSRRRSINSPSISRHGSLTSPHRRSSITSPLRRSSTTSLGQGSPYKRSSSFRRQASMSSVGSFISDLPDSSDTSSMLSLGSFGSPYGGSPFSPGPGDQPDKDFNRTSSFMSDISDVFDNESVEDFGEADFKELETVAEDAFDLAPATPGRINTQPPPKTTPHKGFRKSLSPGSPPRKSMSSRTSPQRSPPYLKHKRSRSRKSVNK